MKHERDKNKSNQDHPIYGIPILVKTIQTWSMPTTAGTHLLKIIIAADAFIITQIKIKVLLF
jgi:amidase